MWILLVSTVVLFLLPITNGGFIEDKDSKEIDEAINRITNKLTEIEN